jgi:hypothetical protein
MGWPAQPLLPLGLGLGLGMGMGMGMGMGTWHLAPGAGG